MRDSLWLEYFIQYLEKEWVGLPDKCSGGKWTDHMLKIIDFIGKKLYWYPVHIRSKKKSGEYSHEYFKIDVFYIHEREYEFFDEDPEDYDPFVLPEGVVELENKYEIAKIKQCLWKLLCIRSPLRILICYQKNKEEVIKLKQDLEDMIIKNELMKGDNGTLLVVIGDESKGNSKNWREYFKIFELKRNLELEEVKEK